MYTRPMLKYIIKSSRARNLIPLILFSCVIGIHVEAIGKEEFKGVMVGSRSEPDKEDFRTARQQG